jgi:hypothetical protein
MNMEIRASKGTPTIDPKLPVAAETCSNGPTQSMRSVIAWKRAAIHKPILAGYSARASAHPTF